MLLLGGSAILNKMTGMRLEASFFRSGHRDTILRIIALVSGSHGSLRLFCGRPPVPVRFFVLAGIGDADDIAGGFFRLNVKPLISVLAGYQFTVMLVNHVDAVPQFPRHFPRIGCYGEAV